MALGEPVRGCGERRSRCRELACGWASDPARMVIASVVLSWLGHAAWRDILFGKTGSSLRGEEAMDVFLFECAVERELLCHLGIHQSS